MFYQCNKALAFCSDNKVERNQACFCSSSNNCKTDCKITAKKKQVEKVGLNVLSMQ
jgi:hypothetical protein